VIRARPARLSIPSLVYHITIRTGLNEADPTEGLQSIGGPKCDQGGGLRWRVNEHADSDAGFI